MAETKYSGSCHCGAVKFDITANIEGLIECNCSICSRVGWRLTFVPETSFNLHEGKDQLQDYQFGKHHFHHAFCRACGVRPFSWGPSEDGSNSYAINTRCLTDFDGSELPVQQYDGASL